jgi:hypothetical protein
MASLSTPRRIAIGLLNFAVRYSSSKGREWASAMLREMDFIDSDWEALSWSLGCTTTIFKHSGDRIWVWLGRQFGYEEGRMNDFQKRAVGVVSGVGIAAAVTICFMVLVHGSAHVFGFTDAPWMMKFVIVMAWVMEVLFAGTVIALWRKRRPMAVGILLTAILLGTHFAMYMSTHLGR